MSSRTRLNKFKDDVRTITFFFISIALNPKEMPLVKRIDLLTCVMQGTVYAVHIACTLLMLCALPKCVPNGLIGLCQLQTLAHQ